MPTTSLGICKLRYLQVSSRIPKRNFQDSAQTNGVEQHSEQSRNPSTQHGILKKAERCICIMSDWPLNSFNHFWLVTLPHMNDVHNIIVFIWRATKLLTPIIKSLATLKVLILNKNSMVYGVNFMQKRIVRVRYSPSLLLLWTLGNAQKGVRPNYQRRRDRGFEGFGRTPFQTSIYFKNSYLSSLSTKRFQV